MKNFSLLVAAVVVVMTFRLRGMMREQVFNATTVWTRVVVLSFLGLVVLVYEMRSVVTLAGLGGGFILGLILGGISLQRTRFRKDATPPRYQTNPYIGAAVVTLFVIRILYDALQARAHAHGGGPVNPLAVSWLASLLYFLFVAYWDVYYIGLIRTFKKRGPRAVS